MNPTTWADFTTTGLTPCNFTQHHCASDIIISFDWTNQKNCKPPCRSIRYDVERVSLGNSFEELRAELRNSSLLHDYARDFAFNLAEIRFHNSYIGNFDNKA